MGLPGVIDPSTYDALKDVLQRQPEITSVTYEPDSISKRSLRAVLDPHRVDPPTGPEPPTLDVEWRYVGDDQYYRIHYADPNTGLHCGWHRDNDHAELGPLHFQVEYLETGSIDREPATFTKTVPTEILWIALEELFGDRLSDLARDNR